MQTAAQEDQSDMAAKNRITINLEDDEYEALLQVSEQQDRSLAWLGRQAISDLLKKESAQGQLRLDGRPQDSRHA